MVVIIYSPEPSCHACMCIYTFERTSGEDGSVRNFLDAAAESRSIHLVAFFALSNGKWRSIHLPQILRSCATACCMIWNWALAGCYVMGEKLVLDYTSPFEDALIRVKHRLWAGRLIHLECWRGNFNILPCAHNTSNIWYLKTLILFILTICENNFLLSFLIIYQIQIFNFFFLRSTIRY